MVLHTTVVGAVASMALSNGGKRLAAQSSDLFSRSLSTTSVAGQSESGNQHLEVSVDQGVRTIRINRPERYNAINEGLYLSLPLALREASADWPNTRVTVIAGSRKSPYFSSGNDLSDFLKSFKKEQGNMKGMSDRMAATCVEFVDAFIDFGPGLLVAAVHGPAAGISCTSLALCDAVFAADSARFNTPFTQLSQTPEGCSSLMFPQLMGKMKGTDVLALCGTLTAQEAKQHGLVTEVFPSWNFDNEVGRRLKRYASLPPEGFRDTIGLTKFKTEAEKARLKEVNRAEAISLANRWQSQECVQALMKFAQRKK